MCGTKGPEKGLKWASRGHWPKNTSCQLIFYINFLAQEMYQIWKSQLFDIQSNDSKNNISNHECVNLPVDSSEQFLEMCLYNTGVGGLS